MLHAALAAAATLLSLAFALSTLERWLDRRRRHELAWTISLFLFALGSLGLWFGAAIGWNEWDFKAFYLFGAFLNVPFLALGTIYLLARKERTGDIWAVLISLLSAFAAGIVVAAPMVGPIAAGTLPQGKEVFGFGPRFFAAFASGVAATVIVAGAVWSAARLLRLRFRAHKHGTPLVWSGPISPTRLAVANIIIAVGTFILSGGGVANSVLDAMNAFAVSLVAGIAVIFAGFLLTNAPNPVEQWRYQPSDAEAASPLRQRDAS
ncbi:MAG: hypothetical protein HYX32_04430 [Actinobacteria bacterium]|nr:hypothetical protein [Actinomycetota bacterium]